MSPAIDRAWCGKVVPALFAAAAAWCLAASASAQVPAGRGNDALDEARRLNEVAAQKIEAEIRDVLREAQRLTAADPAKAADRLKDGLARLESDTALSQSRREALKRMLNDRIRVTEADANRAAEQSAAKVEAAGRRVETDRRAAELETIGRTLAAAQALQKEGKTAEANRLAADLARRYPDLPALQASGRISSAADQVATARALQADRDRRMAGGLRDMERSALPPRGDVEFPKDWADKVKNRTTSIPLTVKEKAILNALNSTISVSFKDMPFEAVIEHLSTFTNQPIVLDKMALEEAQVTYETPITVRLKGVTVRTVLRKILAEFGLAYVIKEETIQVMSVAKAKDMLVTRSYPIGDLVRGLNPYGARALRFPQIDDYYTKQYAALLMEHIPNMVDPDSWRANGGAGTITFHAPTLSFVIRQSTEVHALLGNGLLR